jgi:uncharacterized protein (DUF1330 family)
VKTNLKLAVAVLAGLSMGVAGARLIYAQQVKAPPAYVIAEVDVTDPDNMAIYGKQVPDTLAPFNHHNLVIGGKTQSLEGEPPKPIVVIAFDSADKARDWYDSPAYAAIRPIRQRSAKSRVFIVEGVVPQ